MLLGLDDRSPTLRRRSRRRGSRRRFRRRRSGRQIRPFRLAVTVWKALPSRGRGHDQRRVYRNSAGHCSRSCWSSRRSIDVRTFTISNRLNLTVALLAPLYWLSVGLAALAGRRRSRSRSRPASSLLLAGAFYAGMMGGGDVKLAAALALWFSPVDDDQLPGLHVDRRRRADARRADLSPAARKSPERPEIPYGVAIAFGGLAILTQRFLNQFA